MSERFPGIDWYCDRCNVYLNDQPGFDDHHYVWKCTECGHKNSISADDIYESEEDFRKSHCQSINIVRIRFPVFFHLLKNCFVLFVPKVQ